MSITGKRRTLLSAKTLGLRSLWYDRSVRTQLLVAIGAVNLLAAFVAGAVWIYNTRSSTRVEIEASLEIAQRFVASTIRDLDSQGRLDQLSEQLPLRLKNLRHVRVLLMEGGKLSMLSPEPARGERAALRAPKWFAALVGPKQAGRSIRVVAAHHADPVIIIGEPADEIAEAWRDFYSLAIIWLTLDALVLAILYVVLGRILDPLASLARGMQDLKGGQYATRLEPPKVKELAKITNRFNMLAGGLDAAREENSRLYRQLISAQEQVRREIANELHDEAGACLFGITASASSIRTFADRLVDGRKAEVGQHVGAILSGAERLKIMNRAILKRLRPGPLGQVNLAQLVDELVGGLQRSHSETRIVPEIGHLANSYGETIDLTLYRCIQEGITTAIRHGKAANISIDLEEHRGNRKAARPRLRLTLRDDGTGFSTLAPKDFGLATMTERVRSIGGSCRIKSAPSKGTTIRIEIPIRRAEAGRALALT